MYNVPVPVQCTYTVCTLYMYTVCTVLVHVQCTMYNVYAHVQMYIMCISVFPRINVNGGSGTCT